jgi:hypothetical protein
LINLVIELVGLHSGYWTFPGEYIGVVSLMGATFPIEEFFFYVILSSATIISYYELFVDDMK